MLRVIRGGDRINGWQFQMRKATAIDLSFGRKDRTEHSDLMTVFPTLKELCEKEYLNSSPWNYREFS